MSQGIHSRERVYVERIDRRQRQKANTETEVARAFMTKKLPLEYNTRLYEKIIKTISRNVVPETSNPQQIDISQKAHYLMLLYEILKADITDDFFLCSEGDQQEHEIRFIAKNKKIYTALRIGSNKDQQVPEKTNIRVTPQDFNTMMKRRAENTENKDFKSIDMEIITIPIRWLPFSSQTIRYIDHVLSSKESHIKSVIDLLIIFLDEAMKNEHWSLIQFQRRAQEFQDKKLLPHREHLPKNTLEAVRELIDRIFPL